MARTLIMYVVCVCVFVYVLKRRIIQKLKSCFEQLDHISCYIVNVCVQASTQTDAMRVPVSRRRQMKNKSVLCRPFTMDQESYCQLPGPSTGSEGNYKKHFNKRV